MSRSNFSLACGTFCILAVVCWSSIASAEIVNIDFNGVRNNETVGLTFSGAGPAGGGSRPFNGLIADSRGTPENDLLTVSGSNLVDSYGAATTIGFSITNVGGDNGGTGSDPTAAPALYGDYILSRATLPQLAEGVLDPTFTFSGLGSATKADVYFYAADGSTIAIGGTVATATSQGGGHSLLRFQDVPVTGGQIVGTFGSKFSAAYGATISTVPEPSTLAMLAAGLFGLLACAWRKRK